MIVYTDYKEAIEVARKTQASIISNPNGEGWIVRNPRKKLPDNNQNASTNKSIGSSSNNYTFSEAKIIASKMPYARVVKDSDGTGYVIKQKGVTIRPRVSVHTKNKYSSDKKFPKKNRTKKAPKKSGVKKHRPKQSPSKNKYDQMSNIPEDQKRKADEGFGGSREATKRNRRGYFGDGK